MMLYYMTSERFGLKDISERRLKISTLAELNDPFELLGVSLGEKRTRRAMKLLHDHWSKNLGIVCFTDNWRSPVMWAHYADKHNGICLGFEVPDKSRHFQKVTYVPTRLRRLLDKKTSVQGLDVSLLEAILTTKYRDWSYECEYRAFTEMEVRDKDGFAHLDFSDYLQLRQVIVGSRSKLTVEAVAATVGKAPYSVEVLKARPAFKTFGIVRDKSIAPIVVPPTPAAP